MPVGLWPHQQEAIDKLVAKLADARAAQNEEAIKTLLGGWISELEPSVAYGPDGRVVGLAAPGGDPCHFLLPAGRRRIYGQGA